MKYEIGQKVETPLGVGEVIDIFTREDKTISECKVCIKTHSVWFGVDDLKPYKTPHEKLLDMGFEMVLDDEHFTIFEHQELDYTIRIDKLWKGIGIHHYNDDPNYRYIYLKLSQILTEYLEWLEEEK